MTCCFSSPVTDGAPPQEHAEDIILTISFLLFKEPFNPAGSSTPLHNTAARFLQSVVSTQYIRAQSPYCLLYLISGTCPILKY